MITVAPQAGAAPIFIQRGKGGTYNRDVVQCVNFDLEVKDDDSQVVAILAAETLPNGAVLTTKGDKRAELNWCPTDDQVNEALSWVLRFHADDGEHTATPHDYHAVLRKTAGSECPGELPVVTINSPDEGATVQSGAGFPVSISVTDDTGVRDAPILYYSTKDPGDNPDVTTFGQTTFEDVTGGSWSAEIPPLGLGDGEQKDVWFIVSAVDNNDETGTLCDHRTDTPTRRSTASRSGDQAENCKVCGAAADCESGVCAASGTCVPACNECPGTCLEVATMSGATAESCGGEKVCDIVPSEPADCQDDALDDGSIAKAVSILESP